MIRNFIIAFLLSFYAFNNGFADTWESVLQKFNNETDPSTAALILTAYAESASKPEEKYRAYVKAAYLYNLLGHYENAQNFFEKAFSAVPDHPDFLMLLYSAVLLIETNQWERAENQLDICLIRCQDENLLSTAHFYLAYLFFLKDEPELCTDHVQKILDINFVDSSSYLTEYLPWIVKFSERYPENFQKIIALLKTSGHSLENVTFDNRLLSPVMMLSNHAATTTVTDLPDETEKPPVQKQKLIVAGSYAKRENADAVLQDLEMQGFSGKIREINQNGKKFFRIYVLPIENDYQNTLSFLQQLDIAAFIVNDVY